MALDIISYFKNLSLSKEDKLLKDLGLEEPTGTPTAKGLELSALLNYQANRDEIIAHAVTLDEEEAK